MTEFAEPEGPKGARTRTWVTIKDQPIAAWGGLWRESAEWGPVYSGAMTDCNEAMRPLHDRITLLRITSMAHPKRINKSLREVTAIWRAIQNGDADLAEKCCADHVQAAAVAALSMIERTSVAEEKALPDE